MVVQMVPGITGLDLLGVPESEAAKRVKQTADFDVTITGVGELSGVAEKTVGFRRGEFRCSIIERST